MAATVTFIELVGAVLTLDSLISLWFCHFWL